MIKRKDGAPKAAEESLGNKAGKHTSRRGLLKGSIISGIAFAATAGAAKKAGDYLLKPDFNRLNEADELKAEQAWKGKKLVLMSKAEKDEMIRVFEKGVE